MTDPSITFEQVFLAVSGGIALASLLIWRADKWTL
jgi:hypothetical protein